MNEVLRGLVHGDGRQIESVARERWPDFLRFLAEEELEGFLYYHSQQLGLELPPGAIETLRRHYRQTAQRNVVRVRQLTPVLEASRRLGIGILVLPGAGLLSVYPDPGCRPMDDIDLLGAPPDLPRLRELLSAMGFSHPERHPDIMGLGPLQLDLHDDVVNSSRVGSRRHGGWMSVEAVWEERQLVRIDGVELATMGVRDMVLYTCLHSLRHGYSRYTWFFDLHYLLCREIEWNALIDRARGFRLIRPLFYGMHYMCASMQHTPATELRDWMTGYRFRLGEKLILRRALADRHRGEWGDPLWSYNVGGIWRRSLFLLQTAFPGRDVLLQVFPIVPQFLSPLVYPLRVLQLLLRSAKQARSWIWPS